MKVNDVPASVTLKAVDEFAVWALRTIRSLSQASEKEAISEIVIPLVQPWLPTEKPLIGADAFNDAISNAGNGKPILLLFDFPPNDLLDSRARLKSISVSFGNKFELVEGSGIDRNQTADAFTRLTIRITPPPQQAEDGTTYQRPEVMIGNVGLHGSSGMAAVEGNAIENLSPFGRWNIAVHPLLVWKDGSRRVVSDKNYSDVIKDLKIAFRFYVPGTYAVIDPGALEM